MHGQEQNTDAVQETRLDSRATEQHLDKSKSRILMLYRRLGSTVDQRLDRSRILMLYRRLSSTVDQRLDKSRILTLY